MAGMRVALDRRSVAIQVRDDLREKMRSGEFAAGAKLPSEPASARIYGVSRATVREAYRLLEQERLVEVRPGSGRYVLPGATLVVQGSINLVESTTKILTDLGYDLKVRLIGTTERQATDAERSVFDLADDTRILDVERAYTSNGELLTHAINSIDPSRTPLPIEEMDLTSSLADAYAAVGRRIDAGFSDIAAATVPPRLAEMFHVPTTAAWLRFDGPLFDQHGQPLWWSRELWRGDVRTLRVVNRRSNEFI
ncbi:GntR family transcriptional regulator [Acidipropionibacterium virtanenii]|uniref:Mannosyl-D-glycerate transport/metabolism system repressor MngR n=1 Tax=Acidipropionibacterium virtanenii TaxID=2057246 RepID=A0A344UQW0_9ACTN|nr:GntR family transcriptional regulator [Acidipropionibacterium virtanenii]AXE37658.1 Mannosyl-D-glycerate transport/metabolism system repressor MngR [Acidipropionibacterium virtanenii]